MTNFSIARADRELEKMVSDATKDVWDVTVRHLRGNDKSYSIAGSEFLDRADAAVLLAAAVNAIHFPSQQK